MKCRHILAVIMILFLSGCAASIHDRSAVGYVAEGFSPDALRKEGMALLPVVAGQGQEAYRRPFGAELVRSCEMAMADGRFLDWQSTMEVLNANDLAGRYNDLIKTYRETAILRSEYIFDLCEALGTRYLLFASLEEFHSQKSTSYNFFSGWTTERNSAVSAFCQVWDGVTGDIVWEGKASASSSGGEMTYDKPYESYAQVAAQGLAKRLFPTVSFGRGTR